MVTGFSAQVLILSLPIRTLDSREVSDSRSHLARRSQVLDGDIHNREILMLLEFVDRKLAVDLPKAAQG